MLTAKKPGLLRALSSPVGRKLLTGITGLGLTLFVFAHMTGNLGYFSGAEAYNKYADFLVYGIGPLIYIIEAGLLLFFLIHIYEGIAIWLGKKKARPQGYRKYQTSGGPSKQTISSRSMIVTGLILLVFLVIHLWSFKYGPGVDEGYVMTLDDGTEIRDLARLVTEKFQHWYYTFGYVAVMLLLAAHLRHGFWSAFQSLALTNPRLTPLIYTIGVVLAIAIALGFIALPLYIFFLVDAPEYTASLVSGFSFLVSG